MNSLSERAVKKGLTGIKWGLTPFPTSCYKGVITAVGNLYVKGSCQNKIVGRSTAGTYILMSTTLVIDCENVDSVLGNQILGHKPLATERMQYRMLQPWFRNKLSEPVKAFAVVREGGLEHRKKGIKFWGALQLLQFHVVPAESFAARNNLCRSDSREIVDHVVTHLIERCTTDNIVYVGHDFYAADVLIDQRKRGSRVFAAAFPEFLSARVIDAVEDVYDLEREIGAFLCPLPRLDFST